MTHTDMLEFIINQLNKNGLSLIQIKDIHNFFMPNEDYNSFKSSWSNWLRKETKRINSAKAKELIAKKIGFDVSLWNSDTQIQIEIIKEKIKDLLNPKKEFIIDNLLPKNTPISNEQLDILKTIKDMDKAKLTSVLDKCKFVNSSIDNQEFLIQLISICYKSGLYEFIIDKIEPNLLPHNKNNINIKLKLAHSYASLKEPKYLEATYILESINYDDLDLKNEVITGILSNVRRYIFEQSNIKKDELFEYIKALREYYKNIFNETKHYYPGINLAYLLHLNYYILPNNPIIELNDINNIYEASKTSIISDANSKDKSKRFFAQISKIEFKLHIDKNYTQELLINLLELEKPLCSEVERTIRMKDFFVNTLKKYSKRDAKSLIDRFILHKSALIDYCKSD